MLFHYSCITYQKQVPIFAVHTDGEPLLPGFEIIRQAGGCVQVVPNHRIVNGVEYPPRNTVVALQRVKTESDWVAICDPDMLFMRQFDFANWVVSQGMTQNHVSLDYVGYMSVTEPAFPVEVLPTLLARGVDIERFSARNVDGGVPHIVANCMRKRLTEEWLKWIDYFPSKIPPPNPDRSNYSFPKEPYLYWLASMWALSAAMDQLDLNGIQSNFAASNYNGDELVREAESSPMLHFCYGGEVFNKRNFGWHSHPVRRDFWNLDAIDSSWNSEIRKQIGEAGKFYSCWTM